MMDKKQFIFEVIKLAENFELEYKEILAKYESSIETEIWNQLYDMGAKTKHSIDDIEAFIETHIKE